VSRARLRLVLGCKLDGACTCGAVTWRVDGLDTWQDLPPDRRCVRDPWFRQTKAKDSDR
jgi:hypothetical protein